MKCAPFCADSENKIIKSKGLHFVTDGSVSGAFDIRLLGRFNQENALATALATKALGASLENIHDGLALAVVPGRMELLTAKNGAHIYIDYAHNGLSLENLVEVDFNSNHVIAVFKWTSYIFCHKIGNPFLVVFFYRLVRDNLVIFYRIFC